MESLDDELPECSEVEMWARPEAWAVTCKGASRASKVVRVPGLEGQAQAEAIAKQKGDKYYVEHRIGERVRCEGGYCLASPFCQQFKAYKSVAWNRGEKGKALESEGEKV